MIQIIGIITVSGFSGMCIFQLALALGAPLAHLSWGGRFTGKLPRKLRIASFFSALLFVFGILCILELMAWHVTFHHPALCRYAILGMGILFALSTLGNLASKSQAEKKIMTPVSIFMSILCFLIIV